MNSFYATFESLDERAAEINERLRSLLNSETNIDGLGDDDLIEFED